MPTPNITPAERAALLAVRHRLDRGGISHLPTHPCSFNMRKVLIETDCGTVACIGGWMALEMRGLAGAGQALSYGDRQHAYDFVAETYDRELMQASPALTALFYPPGARQNENWWEDITPDLAVRAIDAFLETGDPKWASICADIMPEGLGG